MYMWALASALPERDLMFTGEVVAVDGDVVELAIVERDAADGTPIMPGGAAVRLPATSMTTGL